MKILFPKQYGAAHVFSEFITAITARMQSKCPDQEVHCPQLSAQ